MLAQRTLERVRKIELALGVEPAHYEGEQGGDPAEREPLGL